MAYDALVRSMIAGGIPKILILCLLLLTLPQIQGAAQVAGPACLQWTCIKDLEQRVPADTAL